MSVEQAIKWTCADNHVVGQTAIEDGKIYVPKCRHKGHTGSGVRADRGVLLVEQDGQLEQVGPSFSKRDSEKAQLALLEGQTWQFFCNILDNSRITMGDGKPGDSMCRACEDRPHAGTLECDCTCHEAWAFRREIERAKAAA